MDKEKMELLREAENTVISCIVYGGEKMYFRYVDAIKEKYFYSPNPKKAIQAIQSIVSDGEIIDRFTVKARLNGNAEYIDTIKEFYTRDDDEIKSRIDFLKDNWKRQTVIEILIDATTKISENSPVDEITAKLLNSINNIDSAGNQIITIRESVFSVMDGITQRLSSNNAITGTPTGLSYFDMFSNGFQEGDLVVIAGETSQGKTALAVTIAKTQSVKYKLPSLFVSIEMTDTQLAGRMMSQETGVSSKILLSGQPTQYQLQQINSNINNLINAPIFIDNNSSTDINEIVSLIYSVKAKHDIKIVYIDYLQLISMRGQKGGTKEQEVADICRLLKNTAKKLKIPIVLLSQLSRDRANPKPTLARLRGSGQIEEAADIVWFVWRPEYYGFEHIELSSGNVIPSINAAHGIIAKGRNIGITDFSMGWDKEKTEFTDYYQQDLSTTEPPAFGGTDDDLYANDSQPEF